MKFDGFSGVFDGLEWSPYERGPTEYKSWGKVGIG